MIDGRCSSYAEVHEFECLRALLKVLFDFITFFAIEVSKGVFCLLL